MHRSTRSLAATFVVVAVAACAPAGEDATGTTRDRPPVSTSSEPATGNTAVSPGTTDIAGDGSPMTAPSEQPTPDPDRPMAPDVSLELADGSTFVLAEEDEPVFLVFWAEW